MCGWEDLRFCAQVATNPRRETITLRISHCGYMMETGKDVTLQRRFSADDVFGLRIFRGKRGESVNNKKSFCEMMKNYVEENERILEKWRKRNEERGENNFADDGIMYRGLIKEYDYGTERFSDKEQENKMWNDAPLRILFLTKDQNAGGYDAWDVRGETGNLSYAFFRNLMYQLYGLVNTTPEHKADYKFTNEQAIELYSTFPIARINAKKEAGTSSISNYTLRDYIERDKDLLKEQILNLDADIIVCCGYSKYIEDSGSLLLNFLKRECYGGLDNKDDSWIDDDGWIYYDKKNNKIAINNWHFSAMKNSEEWYNSVTTAYQIFLSTHPGFTKSHRE